MNDYIGMLEDLGVTQELVDHMTKSGLVTEFESDIYYKDNSSIHGIGVFASKDIYKNNVIGLGTIDNKHKTTLGRFTNHSDNSNARFYYLENKDIIMVAEKYISKGQEILINYRDHVLYKKKFIAL